MKATEFAYWLQGHFEIKGDSTLTKPQAEQVLKKAQSVVAGSAPAEAEAYAFASYAQGLLTAAIDGGNLQSTSKQLQDKLNDLFVHAIDPSYAGDQTQFGQIHKPGGPGNGMRC